MAVPLPFDDLPLGPQAVLNLARIAAPAQFDAATDPDRFSFREDVAHLADLEVGFSDRIKTILANPGGSISPIDIDRTYPDANPLEEAKRLIRLRRQTIELLKSIDPDRRLDFGVHTEIGKITIADVANKLVVHDLYHIEHMTAILADTSK